VDGLSVGSRVADRGSRLRADLLAGLTAGAVVIPQAMAYATIAGLPLQYGLYCALVPTAIYALLGTSRPLSVSTTSSISLLTATVIAETSGTADPALVASLLAILAGGLLVAGGILRLGFIADFISRPILDGFKVGMGLTIAASQIGKILGIPVTGDTFFPKVASALEGIGGTNPWTFGLALLTIALLLVVRRVDRRLPGPLIGLVVGMAAIAWTGLTDRGVSTVAAVPGGIPAPLIPDLGLAGDLVIPSLAIALMAFVESMAAARAFRALDDRPLDADRELIAIGVANVAGGFFRAYGSGGGLSQTAVNDAAGARSQGAGLVTAGLTALVLLFLAPLLSLIPEATLGAIVLVAAFGLLDATDLREVASIRRSDLAMGLVTLGAVLVLGTIQGLFVGVLASVLSLLRRMNYPPVIVLARNQADGTYRDIARQVGDESVPGLLIIRIESALYFGNSQRIFDRVAELVVEARPQPRVLVLDMSAVPDIDTTAIIVARERATNLRDAGTDMWVAGLTERALRIAKRTPRWAALVAAEEVYPSVDAAVEAFRRQAVADAGVTQG
jgi:sulfate permease, SulP family